MFYWSGVVQLDGLLQWTESSSVELDQKQCQLDGLQVRVEMEHLLMELLLDSFV